MKKERESGIELLKLIAMGIIILFHVTQTLSTYDEALVSLWGVDYHLDLNAASSNIQQIILMLIRQGGLGSHIFFVCSAWFLCTSKKRTKGSKVLKILLDVWIISVVIMAIYVLTGQNITTGDIKRSLFPIMFGNNWYISCYLIIYLIYPFLNWIIERMTKKELFTANLIAFVLYYCIGYVYQGSYQFSNLVLFVILYFMVAYVRLYLESYAGNMRFWICLMVIGFAGYLGVPLLQNFIGLHVSYYSESALRWAGFQTPFLPIISISLLQIFRSIRFTSRIINRISACTLYIYVIHENLLFRTYTRPWIFYLIYTNFGYQYILLWVLVYAFALAVGTTGISLFYHYTVSRGTEWLSERGAKKIYMLYNRIGADTFVH